MDAMRSLDFFRPRRMCLILERRRKTREMSKDDIDDELRRAAWSDLRRCLAIVEDRGELQHVDGADPNLEMGAIYELSLEKLYPPVLLFKNMVGVDHRFRVATNVRNS